MLRRAAQEGPGSACFVALTYVIKPQTLGEQKSKPAQLGIKRLMEAGIQPHMIGCRAHNPVTETVRQKISMFSNVLLNRVFSKQGQMVFSDAYQEVIAATPHIKTRSMLSCLILLVLATAVVALVGYCAAH